MANSTPSKYHDTGGAYILNIHARTTLSIKPIKLA